MKENLAMILFGAFTDVKAKEQKNKNS